MTIAPDVSVIARHFPRLTERGIKVTILGSMPHFLAVVMVKDMPADLAAAMPAPRDGDGKLCGWYRTNAVESTLEMMRMKASR